MKYVGAHVSASGGVFNAPINAKAIGAKAFALFVKNQRQWAAKDFEPKVLDKQRISYKKSYTFNYHNIYFYSMC